MFLLITGVLDMSIVRNFKNTMFRKLDLFPSASDRRETYTLLGPLERVASIADPVTEVTSF
jgi:hypothetical protein